MELKQTETFRLWESKLKDRGDIAPIGEGVSELRIHFGPGYRVYFQQRGNAIVVLLCGGAKASQARDILAAKKLAREWRN